MLLFTMNVCSTTGLIELEAETTVADVLPTRARPARDSEQFEQR